MDILIAGCGYVGMRAASFWLNAGHSVSAITRSDTRARQLHESGIEPLLMDLGDPSSWPQLPPVDLLLWSVGFDRSSNQPRELIWVDGLRSLLQALTFRSGARILMTSSTGVYGDAQGDDVTEATHAIPSSESGRACLKSEDALREFSSRAGVTTCILRLAGIYGPGRLLRRVEELQNQVPIPSPPDDWLNLVHVDDIIRTLHFVATMPAPPALMNVAASDTATRRQYYSVLAELTQSPPPVFAAPTSAAVSPELSPTGRRANGNRRVTSSIRQKIGLTFEHESVTSGLTRALQ